MDTSCGAYVFGGGTTCYPAGGVGLKKAIDHSTSKRVMVDKKVTDIASELIELIALIGLSLL